MFDDFMTKLARRAGENVGKSKIELLRAQVEYEFGLNEFEDDEENKSGSEQEKREKLEKMAIEMGIEDTEGKNDDELIDEIAGNLSE